MASRRWGAVTAAVLVAIAACGGKNKRVETAPPEVAPADPHAALLRLLEPEPVAIPKPPPWARELLFPGGYQQAQLVELVEQSTNGNVGILPAAVIAMSIEQDLAARAACDDRCKRALFGAYLTLRRHEMLGRDLLIRTISGAEVWTGAGPGRGIDIAGYTNDLVASLAGRSRALVAERIRAAPADNATIQSMLALSNVEQTLGSYELARALAAGAVAGAATPAADLTEAAESCYRAAGLDCGDRSLQRARQASGHADIDAARWAALETLKKKAHRAAELEGKPEHQRELAPLLVELSRETEAARLFAALIERYPKDAQMALGLARIQRAKTLQSDAARTILAAGPENRDAAFHRVASGILAHYVFLLISEGNNDEIIKLAPAIRSTFDEFAKHELDRAEILRAGLDMVLELITARSDDPLADWADSATLQKAIGRLVDAQKRQPESEPLARIVLFVSVLDKDVKRKNKAIGSIARAFADKPELASLIRNAQILLGDEGIAKVIATLSEVTEPSDEQRRLWIDLRASQTDLAKKDEWTAIASYYGEMLQASDSPDPRSVNNYGTALHHIGAPDQARQVWGRAIQLGADHPAPGINLYATGEQDRERLWEWIESKLSQPNSDTSRLARRWKIKVTVTDPKERKKQLAALEAEPRFKIGTGGIDGAILAVSYELGIGYSTSEDLVFNINLNVEPWLVLE